MNEIAGLPSSLAMGGAGAETVKAKNTMGKDDFMKLLMTQLRYQDPLKPMDHEQFAAQLAQFGTLEQLANIGTGIQGLKTGMGEGSKLQAIGMIGKDIQAASSELEVKEGIPLSIPIPRPSDSTPTKILISDAQGTPVREMELVGQKDTAIQWDGKNQDGGSVPSGKYSFRVLGLSQNGESREIGSELSGRVTGVEMQGQVPVLLVQTPSGPQKVEMAKVQQVKLVEPAPPPAVPNLKTELKPPTSAAAETGEVAALEPPSSAPSELEASGHAPDFGALMAGMK